MTAPEGSQINEIERGPEQAAAIPATVPAVPNSPPKPATRPKAGTVAIPEAPRHHGFPARILLSIYAGIRWLMLKIVPINHPLLRQEPFRAFWLSRFIGQAAQGAVLYALLIVIVDRTDDPFFGSLFVACSIVPSLILGLPGGLVVDVVSRRALFVWLNVVRAGVLLLLVAPDPSLLAIFIVTIGIWTVHQFYNPAEGATPASLVPDKSLPDAQALSNLALTFAQFAGMVVAGPVFLRFASPEALFAFCAALFIAAGMLTASMPPIRPVTSAQRDALRAASKDEGWRGLLFEGWRSIVSDRAVLKAMADDVLVGVGLSALVVIAPFYLVRVLGTSSENTVFVFAPAAFGLVVGLRLAPAIGRFFGLQGAVSVALFLFAICVGSLGFVEQLDNWLNRIGFPLRSLANGLGIPPLVVVCMFLSVPAGFASAIVGVSARAVLLRRTPSAALGQVVATQNVLGNVGALFPTLLAGITTDWLGVKAIAVAIAVIIIAGAIVVNILTKRLSPKLPVHAPVA
jgi:MFS family permease